MVKGFAGNADPIAHVEALVDFPLLFAELLFVEVNLNATFGVAEGTEDAFAEITNRFHATGDGGREVVLEVGFELAGGVGSRKGLTIRVVAHLAKFAQFLAANGNQFFDGGLRLVGWGVCAHEFGDRLINEVHRDEQGKERSFVAVGVKFYALWELDFMHFSVIF